MGTPLADFARSVAAAYRDLPGFTATETIRGSGFEVKARVRFARPERLAVDYSTYEDPIAGLDEALTAAREFTGEELIGMTIVYDGRLTWIHDPKANVAIRKPWRSVFEPLPGIDAVGEIGFLEWLTRGFLLRDAGEGEVDGRKARLVGLKPKRPYRSQLLTSVSFPIRRATVAFDQETLFPLRIAFSPGHGSALFPLIGPNGEITIEYTDVRLGAPDPETFSFSPTEETRVFLEEPLDREDPTGRLPFPLSIEPLSEAGFRLIEGGTAAVDEKNGKGYCTLPFAKDGSAGSSLVTLRAGNYLSRNMSRRKSLAAEKGKRIELAENEGWLLDRRSLLGLDLPGEKDHPLCEISWGRDGLFLFLIGDGVGEEELISLAESLDRAGSNP